MDSLHIIALGKHAVSLKKYQTSNNLRQHRGLRNRDVFASGVKEHSECMEGQKDVRYLDGGGVTDVENERWWEEWWLNWLKASTGVNKKRKEERKPGFIRQGRFTGPSSKEGGIINLIESTLIWCSKEVATVHLKHTLLSFSCTVTIIRIHLGLHSCSV